MEGNQKFGETAKTQTAKTESTKENTVLHTAKALLNLTKCSNL